MGTSVSTVDDTSSAFDDSDWHVISDETAAPLQPNQLALVPRDPRQLAFDRHTVGRPLAVPGVSRPGMINSLPMVSQAKCIPAQPPPVLESHYPRSLQFDNLALASCRPIPLVYDHQPPGPGEKRLKTGNEGAANQDEDT